jgi:hypothetical protein
MSGQELRTNDQSVGKNMGATPNNTRIGFIGAGIMGEIPVLINRCPSTRPSSFD